MNILPKKSWHVRNKDNIAKVRRDEENARLEEEKVEKRAALAEQEARTTLLRDRVHGSQGHSSIESPSSTTILPYSESQTQHINLFKEEGSGTAGTKTTNQEYEAEKKAEQEKQEKAIGVLKYLGQSTVEGETPWYLKKESKDDENMSKIQSTKDTDKKNRLDPLCEMSSFLEKAKKSELKKKEKVKEKVKKEKRRHKVENPREGKKTIEQLRAERLQREKEERFREEKLTRESKDRKAGKKVEEEVDQYKGSYYSQYNPDLARKPKWNGRYQPY